MEDIFMDTAKVMAKGQVCASKDDEVVEFALSRSLSPTMVSEYTLKLIDKNLLQRKLKEYVDIAEETNE